MWWLEGGLKEGGGGGRVERGLEGRGSGLQRV